MPLLFSSWENKLMIAENIRSNYWFNPTYRINSFFTPIQNKVIKAIQIFVYALLNWYTFYTYKQQLKERILHTKQYNIIRNWLIIFCVFFTLQAILLVLGVYNVVTLQTKAVFLERNYLYLLFMSMGFLTLNLVLLMIPQILYGLPFERTGKDIHPIDDGEIEILPELAIEEDINIPSFYSDHYLAEIKQSIKKAEDDKLFLNPDFNKEDISNMSGIPSHHLAFFFSNIHDSGFSEWRNSLRVQHSIKLITEGALKKHSFEGIASQCGFSSRHTFIRAFKSKMGQTPTEYCRLENLN